MRDRENVVTSYPKEDIIKLSQLIGPNNSVRTPSDRSSIKEIYNIINTRRPRVWISRCTNYRYIQSFSTRSLVIVNGTPRMHDATL